MLGEWKMDIQHNIVTDTQMKNMTKMRQDEMKKPILTEQEKTGEEHDHEIAERKNIPPGIYVKLFVSKKSAIHKL